MNSVLGAPSGPGAKSSVARAADVKAYAYTIAGGRHSGPVASPKAERERVGVEGTLSTQEAFREEHIRSLINLRGHSRSALTFWHCESVERTREYEMGTRQILPMTNEPLGMK